ncbi:hypothetical protein BT96DRAFT_840962, partial [Gymnopus androsaceus JB14]
QKLRESQLRSSLDHLRNNLHMKARLLTYRTTNVAHQGMVRKSQALFQRSQRLINLSARKDSDARAALVWIVGEQKVGWKKLQPSDICMLDDRNMAVGMSRKKLGKKRRAEMRAQAAEQEQAENVRVGMDARQKELECMQKGLGEGTRSTSWIWMEGGGELIDQEALEEGIFTSYG